MTSSQVLCRIQIKKSVRRHLARIPDRDQRRIRDEIDSLGEYPFKGEILKGVQRGTRNIRVRSYRSLYEIHRNRLTVLVIVGLAQQ